MTWQIKNHVNRAPGAPNSEAAEEKSTDAATGCASTAALMSAADASFGAKTALRNLKDKDPLLRCLECQAMVSTAAPLRTTDAILWREARPAQ